MKEAQPGRFNQLSATRFARFLESFKEWNERIGLWDLLVAALMATAVVFMVDSGSNTLRTPTLREGEVAQYTIRATKPLEVEDAEALDTERTKLAARLPDVYDFNPRAAASWIDRWKSAVRQLRRNYASYDSRSEGAKALSAALGVPVSAEEYRVLESLRFSPELERSIALSLAPLWDQKIVANKNFGPLGLELVDIKTSQSIFLKESDLAGFMAIDEAASLVGRAAKTLPKGRVGSLRLPWGKWSPAARNVVFSVQSRLVTPNVTLNRKETEERHAAAQKDLKPSFQKFERGEVIVREGQRVSKHDAHVLSGLNQQTNTNADESNRLAKVLFGTFFLWILVVFTRKQFPTVMRSTKDNLVSALFLISSLAALKLALIFQLSILSDSLANVPQVFLVFLIPVAAPAMTLRLLVEKPLTVMFSCLFALGASLIVGKAALFGIYVLMSSLVGPMFLSHCRTRASLYKAGFWTALVCGVGACCLVAAWSGRIPFSDLKEPGETSVSLSTLLVWTFLGGCIGGWLSSALALVLTPLLENILDYTTDLKLLELARMDHPLLRDLVLKAPGTYHHSIIVGSLVEAGAEAIGANALLARVGSYYHDIGKIGRAEYFVENQTGGNNPHDHTTPQLSAKIIISHVKEGLQLAADYKLGKRITDFIATHHGDSLVNYFYNKAKQDAAQPGSTINPDEIVEDAFRYPGPKPRTREESILSLADSCEAATRSLVDPTPARLEGMVNKIILKAYGEGLLEDADITLREIHLVGKAFLRILLGIHHNRIQYPDQEKGLPPRPVAVLKTSNNR